MNSIKKYLKRRKERLIQNWEHFVCKHILTSKLIRMHHKKHIGNDKYSIIAACYNVEDYIQEFIESLINQRLDFKNNIFLCCSYDYPP